jgi:hypothetical protein
VSQLVRTAYGQIALLSETRELFIMPVINQTQLVDQQKIIKLTIPAYSLLFIKQNQCWTSTSFSWSFYFNGKDSSVESFETIYAEFSGEICFHEPILLPAKPLNIDEEEDEEEEDNVTWMERTQFLSDQEIKDALETIRTKVWDLIVMWILSAQNSSIYNCVDLLIKDGDFIHKKATNYLYQAKKLHLTDKIKSNFLLPLAKVVN